MVAGTHGTVLLDRIGGRDKQVVFCTGQCHIKHVEVVDTHVGVLFLILRAIGRIRHLCAVLDRNKVLIPYLFRHPAPYLLRVFACLFGPHAERYKKRLGLKSFAGMHSQDTDSIHGGGRDGFLMQCILPIGQEILHIAPVCAYILARSV